MLSNFFRKLELLGLILKHIGERSLFASSQLILNLLYVCDATVSSVAPLGIVFASEELLLAIIQRFLLL